MNTVRVGRWLYHFDAPDALVIDVVPADDAMPKSAQIIHWPSRNCGLTGGHTCDECGLYQYITTPVTIQRVA